jgi:hypothetical protein
MAGGADRSANFRVPALTWERAISLHLDQAFRARIAGSSMNPADFRGTEANGDEHMAWRATLDEDEHYVHAIAL